MIFLKAFIVGGLICVIGQLLIDYTRQDDFTCSKQGMECKKSSRHYY